MIREESGLLKMEMEEDKKRERPKRRRFRLGFYLLNIILFLIIVVVLSVAIVVFFCQTENVKVTGNTIHADADIESAVLTDPYDKYAVYAVLRNQFMGHVYIPFVESYKVTMTNRNTVKIKVKEKNLYGYMLGDKDEEYVYFDENGVVTQVSDRLIEGVFFVEGLRAEKAEEGQPLPVGSSNIKTILMIEKEVLSWDYEITRVKFSDDGTISFKVNKIKVNLGTRSSMEQKLKRLIYIIPKIEGKKGTLHLEEWSEDNTDIIFEK